MYRQHFALSTVSQTENSLSELFFASLLHLSSQMFFHFMQHVLNWITVQGLREDMPPVDSMVTDEVWNLGICVLRIIVLNDSVPIWIEFFDNWQKCLLKYVNIDNCNCTSFNDANTQSTFLADGSPHMYLCRVLWSGFIPGFQT